MSTKQQRERWRQERLERHRAIVRAYQAGSMAARVRACPACGVLPGAPCRTRAGKATRSHRDRWATPPKPGEG